MAGRVLLGTESWRPCTKGGGVTAAKATLSADCHAEVPQSPSTPRCSPSMTVLKDMARRSRKFIGSSKFCSRAPSDADELEFSSESWECEALDEARVRSYAPLPFRGSMRMPRSSDSSLHYSSASISSRYSLMHGVSTDASRYSVLPPRFSRASSNLSSSAAAINWVASVPPEDRITGSKHRSVRISSESDCENERQPLKKRSPTIAPSDFIELTDGVKSFKLSPLLAYVVGRDEDKSWSPKALNRSFFMNAWHNAPFVNSHYAYSQGLAGMVFAPSCKVMILWDLVLLCGVSWTLIFTPLEIAFPWEGAADGEGRNCIIHGLNICVNVIFVVDILVQFNLAYDERSSNGSRTVTNRYLIARRYVTGRLLLDIVCAFPFWRLVDYLGLIQTPLAVIKLFRLLRIMRLTRGNFIITRPIMPFWMKTCVKLASMTFFAAHIFSCTWAALATLNSKSETWLDRLASEKVGIDESTRHNMLSVYLWSAYFSITLITTVGFGDVTPQNDLECLVAMLGVTCGSVIWAYILSCLFSVLAQMDPHRVQFESMMDELWCMTADHSIPGPLLYDVQQYFSECEDIWKLARRRSDLMSHMSPNLRGRMSLALCAEWIGKISYIREMFLMGIPATTGFLAEIACKLEAKVFSPGEKLENALYIIRKGLIGQGCRVFSVGDVCGEDFMVRNPKNRISFLPLALTMVGTLTLSCEDFAEILHRFPEHAKVVRYYSNWLALKYGIGRVLRSYAPQDASFSPKSVTGSTSSMVGIVRRSSRDHPGA